MKFKNSIFNVGYPLYSIKFLDGSHVQSNQDKPLNSESESTRFIVTGGGGEGKNGIDNKFTLLEYNDNNQKDIKTDSKPTADFKVLNDFILNENDDSPTAMDLTFIENSKSIENCVILACNDNSSNIKAGLGNKNLKKFLLNKNNKNNDLLNLVQSKDLLNSNDPDQYLKKIIISDNNNDKEKKKIKTISVLSNNNILFVLDFNNWDNTVFKLDLNNIFIDEQNNNNIEIKDFTIMNNLMAFITSNNHLFVYSIIEKKQIFSTYSSTSTSSSSSFKLPNDLNLIKLQFINDNNNLLVLTTNKSGITVLNLNIFKNSDAKDSQIVPNVTSQKLITRKYTGITSFAINEAENLLAITTNSNSIILVNLSNFKIIKCWDSVHSFAITSIDISKNGKFIGTVSVDNTVNLIKINSNNINLTDSNLFALLQNKFIGSVILILLLSVIFQLLFTNNHWTNKLIGINDDTISTTANINLDEQRFNEEKQFQDEQKKIVNDYVNNNANENADSFNDPPVSDESNNSYRDPNSSELPDDEKKLEQKLLEEQQRYLEELQFQEEQKRIQQEHIDSELAQEEKENQIKERIAQEEKIQQQQRIKEQERFEEQKRLKEKEQFEAEQRHMEELKFQQEQQQIEEQLKLEQLKAEQESKLTEEQEAFRKQQRENDEEARKIEELIKIAKEREEMAKEQE